MDHGVVIEPERRIPVAHEADVVVLGGGPSGLAASVAASPRHWESTAGCVPWSPPAVL